MKEKLIIIGLGTNARHVYEFVRYYDLYEVAGFAVNDSYRTKESFYNLPVFSLENLVEEYGSDNFVVFVALLWNHLNRDRKQLYDYCKMRGYKMVNLVSPKSIIRGELLGDNCWIHDFVIIQNDAKLESDIAIMAYSLIGADTKVSSHCFFGARSVLGGGSSIGEQSFVGINATVFDDTTIGKKCIIGACTAVKRNMPDYSKYVTPSDNIVIKHYNESEVENKLVFSKNVR
ncbi:MAG: acetyltransferase [Prevotella sp.]|nr:acetyltransferase [Prevotella sp.]